MDPIVSSHLQNKLVALVNELGRYQMQMRSSSYKTKDKKDFSPVTEIDIYCHKKIKDFLQNETPNIFLLSEESTHKSSFLIKNMDLFWCVDPLDGTRDYIEKSDHFAINIALFAKGQVQWGLIHHPASGETLIANRATSQVFFINPENSPRIVESPITSFQIDTVITSARVSMDIEKREQIKVFAEHLSDDAQIMPISSSFKFFLLIKQVAQAYVRKAPCMNWDIAPGFLAAELAGLKIIDLHSGNAFHWPESSLETISAFAIFTPKP